MIFSDASSKIVSKCCFFVFKGFRHIRMIRFHYFSDVKNVFEFVWTWFNLCSTRVGNSDERGSLYLHESGAFIRSLSKTIWRGRSSVDARGCLLSRGWALGYWWPCRTFWPYHGRGTERVTGHPWSTQPAKFALVGDDQILSRLGETWEYQMVKSSDRSRPCLLGYNYRAVVPQGRRTNWSNYLRVTTIHLRR